MTHILGIFDIHVFILFTVNYMESHFLYSVLILALNYQIMILSIWTIYIDFDMKTYYVGLTTC